MTIRCKKCGGVLYHFATDIFGRNFYKCHTLLTAFVLDSRVSHMIPCDAVHNQYGVIFHGGIAVKAGGYTTTMNVD